MLFTTTNVFNWNPPLNHWKQVIEESFMATALFAFVITSLLPHQALAFSQTSEASWHPLVFTLPQGQLRKIVLDGQAYTKPGELGLKPGLTISVLASAYSSTPEQTDGNPFITASGTQVRSGVVAANFLPIGTRLKWGDKELIVEDRLNSRYDDAYIIDMWVPTTADALTFGVRLITVKIVSLP